MTTNEIFEKLLESFHAYYNVYLINEPSPFAAMAEFHSHDEQYFLIKSAKISEAESNEYVYFATVKHLQEETLYNLDAAAWNTGLSKIIPHKNHRNSYIVLFIIADEMDSDVYKKIPKINHYKSYRFSLQGWTNYQLVAIESSSGRMFCNHQGQRWEKLICNIIKSFK